MSTGDSGDRLFHYDESKVDAVRAAKPWMNDPKYFKVVKVSPSAISKMMMHSQFGVDKGIKKAGKPTEVMGLLVGRPDVYDPTHFVIYDAQPLPIEGFETRVIADDEVVVNYMFNLADSNELSHKERFCGWYHSHPFDVDVNNHCFLSNTDISTQLQWQRAEDGNGFPWVAIVIDPLRSLAKERPELAAFRVYPPEYAPPLNELPDGSISTDDKVRIEKWGACWNRYYKLEVKYFMSSMSRNVLNILKNNFLWQNALTSSILHEPDNQKQLTDRFSSVAEKFEAMEHVTRLSSGMLTRSSSSSVTHTSSSSSNLQSSVREDASITKVASTCEDLAVEHCQATVSALVKRSLFSSIA